jgi:uncharacterized protein (DUF1800 family)
MVNAFHPALSADEVRSVWTAYRPDDQRPWNLRAAGHLFRRAGFGASWEQLQQALRDGPQRTIDRLLRPEGDTAAFHRAQDQYEAAVNSIDGLRAWWLRRMIQSPQPLLEKMTLFWHGHFAVSEAKVGNAALMRRHVQLLRTHALGRFDVLLPAVARDPATLLWLDGNANRKIRPNEEYARTVLEAYALGPGVCSQKDIAEAARAFTGWLVLQNEFRFVEHQHDAGEKHILGQTGNFGGDDVLRIALLQPATAKRIVRKLYNWLISETEMAPDEWLAPLDEAFAKDYDVGKLVETILRSNLFFAPFMFRQRVKSPVEFAVGLVRALGEVVPTTHLGQDLAALGQNLYHPPSIQGWQGGPSWINKATLLGRANLAAAMLAGNEPYGNRLDPAALAKKHGHAAPSDAARFLLDLLLQGDVPAAVAEAAAKSTVNLREAAHYIATLPEFQLA